VNIHKFFDDVIADIEHRRELHEATMDHIAVPGSRVYVLHDGRRGWMHGQCGTVVWSNEEWTEAQFPGHGLRRFRTDRISRQPDGPNCARALWDAILAGSGTCREP